MLLLGVALPLATTTPAFAAPPQIAQLTTTAPTMHPGQSAWVSVGWAAPTNITNVAVTVTAPPGFSVRYPSDRAFSSLYGSASLAGGTQDFTAFHLTIPYGATGPVSLDLHATWDPGNSHKHNDTDGKRSLDTTLTVPLAPYTGPDLAVTTTSVTVSRATPAWVRLDVRGGAPSTTGFRLTASGPPGLVVSYPGDGSSSGLDAGDPLLGGATDFTAFHLDASELDPGTYDLQLDETYTTAAAGRATGEVHLVVVP